MSLQSIDTPRCSITVCPYLCMGRETIVGAMICRLLQEKKNPTNAHFLLAKTCAFIIFCTKGELALKNLYSAHDLMPIHMRKLKE